MKKPEEFAGKRVLVTAIGHQDPFFLKTMDYALSADEQIRELRKVLKDSEQSNRIDGPLLSSMMTWQRGLPPDDLDDPSYLEEGESDHFGIWAPEEILVVFQPDPDRDTKIGPMSGRFNLLKKYAAMHCPGVVVRPIQVRGNVADYYNVWRTLQNNYLRVLTTAMNEGGCDLRILIGFGTNAQRMALFNLWLSLPRGRAQLWYVNDKRLTSAQDPACRPYLVGPDLMPDLTLHQRVRELEHEIAQLRAAQLQSALGSGNGIPVSASTDEFRRSRAQQTLDSLISDLQTRGQAIQKRAVQEELARRLSELGEPVSADSLRRWFTEGKKPGDQRRGLYLVWPPHL